MITGNKIWGPSATRKMGMRTIHGIEMFTFLDMPENLYEMLARTADKYPEKCGIYDNWGHSETYASLKRRVDQMAAWLEGEAGVKKGSHVGMLLHNSREFCVTFYALAKMGAVSIPFPTKYREPELRALVGKCRLPRYLTNPGQRRSEWDMAGSDGISRVSAVFRGKSLLTNKMRII